MPRPRTFTIRNWLLLTAVVGVGAAFPEFAVAAPVGMVLTLLALIVVVVVWLVAAMIEPSPQPLATAARRNVLSLAALVVGLTLYAAYGLWFLQPTFD